MNRFFILFFLFANFTNAQVITWSPSFPSIDDSITITYDASLGNASLVNTSFIYAHTGVISKFSSSESDWMNTPIEWHEGADSIILMNNLGNFKHQIKFKVRDYYNVTYNDNVKYLCFVFRDEFGNISGLDIDGSEFLFPFLRMQK